MNSHSSIGCSFVNRSNMNLDVVVYFQRSLSTITQK